MTLYLSRLRLSRSASDAALTTLLDPEDRGQALDAHHRLLWTAFADGPDRRRDFLWRSEGKGRFTVLSHRPPKSHPLFETPQTKEFAPRLAPGDRLAFLLRANATKDRAAAGRDKGPSRRVDVVMDLLFKEAADERSKLRPRLVAEAARAWMDRQGALHGFALEAVAVEDYSAPLLPRRGAGQAGRLGILDLSGLLLVTAPDAFAAQLAGGFGRARAFGCGLMLIRRA